MLNAVEQVVDHSLSLREYVECKEFDLILAELLNIELDVLLREGLGHLPVKEGKALVNDQLPLLGALSVEVRREEHVVTAYWVRDTVDVHRRAVELLLADKTLEDLVGAL